MNKTLRELVEPGLLPYILLLLFAAAAVYYQQFSFALGAGGALFLQLTGDIIQG